MNITAQRHSHDDGYLVTVTDGDGNVVDIADITDPSACHKYSDMMAQLGTVIEPYVAPPPTPSELMRAVDAHLNAAAKLRQYDDIKSAVTYVGDPDPQFNDEGVAYRDWRSAVYRYCHTEFDKVQAGTRTLPTEAELIAELEANTPLSLPNY